VICLQLFFYSFTEKLPRGEWAQFPIKQSAKHFLGSYGVNPNIKHSHGKNSKDPNPQNMYENPLNERCPN
jgi:hypothetical protein